MKARNLLATLAFALAGCASIPEIGITYIPGTNGGLGTVTVTGQKADKVSVVEVPTGTNNVKLLKVTAK